MSETEMRYDRLERSDCDHTAETWGKWPGIAGVYIEKLADIYCRQCASDILGDELMDRLKSENPGYDHAKSDELGNIAAVLSDEEVDCPGQNCGHCGIEIDVKVLHYPDVCRPDWCPQHTDEPAD